jgi:hypothetical protein
MPVIPVNRVLDKKRIFGKMEGQGGGEAQGVADPKKIFNYKFPNRPHFRVRSSVREVVATYSLDEGSMELVIKVPANFPLGSVSVETGKKIGVTTAQWRTW